MSQKNENRNPDEIESDIYETRAHLHETLQELESKLSPKQVMDSAFGHIRDGGANEFFTNLGNTIKQNPVPFLLTGIGLGWLMMVHNQAQQKSYAKNSYGTSGHSSATSTAKPPVPASEVSTNNPVKTAASTASTANSATMANTAKGTTATHTGTATAAPTGPRPDTVGEATHLGTSQHKNDGTRSST